MTTDPRTFNVSGIGGLDGVLRRVYDPTHNALRLTGLGSGGGGDGPVTSVDGQTGDVDLSTSYQPLSTNLSALNVPSTIFGRARLNDNDAAAARTALGVYSTTAVDTDLAGKQPLDTDLTDIAAITRTRGTLIVGGSSAWGGLTVGAAGQVLASDGTDAAWTTPTALDADLVTIGALTRARGDVLVGGASAWTNLPIGAATYILTSNGTDAVWAPLSPSATFGGAVLNTDYNAMSVLAADVDDVPLPVTMAASTTLARLASGGIVAASASQMRTMLGLVPGTDVEAHDADLTAIAALSRTRGDLITGGASAWGRLPVGTTGQLLTSNGTDVTWADPPGATDADLVAIGALTRTRGDLIVGGASTWTDLALGASATVLRSDGTDVTWASLATAGIQPLDSDLTAIAALTTTTFGRSLLTQADAAATLTTIGAQPVDTDLTALAGLSRARGDLITGGASAWQRLAVSATAGAVLRGDGTDPAWVTDLTLPTATVSGGTQSLGWLTASGVSVLNTYTQTADPTNLGVAFLADWNPTLNYTAGMPLVGPRPQQNGYSFGPPGMIHLRGTAIYNYPTGAFGLGPIGMTYQMVMRNAASTAMSLTPSWGFIGSPVFVADGATVTANTTDIPRGGAQFVDASVWMTVNTGTWNGTTHDVEHRSFLSLPIIGGNTHLARRIAYDVSELNTPYSTSGFVLPSPGGTTDADASVVDLQIGLRIPRLTFATANMGISTMVPVEIETDTATFTAEPIPSLTVGYGGVRTLNFTSATFTQSRFGGTYIFQHTASGFGAFSSLNINPVIKNHTSLSGVVAGLMSFSSIIPTVTGDTTNVTYSDVRAFHLGAQFSATNGSALGVEDYTDIYSVPSIGTGVIMATRRVVHVLDFAGSGGTFDQVGVEIDALTKATNNNIGIRSTARVEFSAGVYRGATTGANLALRSTVHATKGDLQLDNPTTELVVTNYTNTAATYAPLLFDATITMNASGGGAGTGNAFRGIDWQPTILFDQAGNIFGAAASFRDTTLYKNVTGEANDTGPITSFTASPTINTDAATTTTAAYTGYSSALSLTRTTSGVLTVTAATHFTAIAAVVPANTVVTTRTGYAYTDATVAGTLTNQYAIDIPALTAAATVNVGIRNAASSILNGGVYGDTATGGNVKISSTTHATKGDIQLDNPTVEFGVTNYTYAGATDYHPIFADNTVTMSGTGGGFANGYSGFLLDQTVVYTAAGNVLGGGTAYTDSNEYKNSGNVSMNGIVSYLAQPTVTADGQTITCGGITGLIVTPLTTIANSGALTVTALNNIIVNGMTVPTGVTVTTRRGLLVNDGGATVGTFTTQYGIDIVALTRAGTNVGIRNASSLLQSGAATLSGTNTISGATSFTTANVTITDVNVVLGTTTGTKFGTAITQKLAFYNATPIVQAASANEAAVGTTAPAGGTGTAAGGWDTAGNRNTAITTINSLVTLTNEIRTVLVNLGLMKGAA